MGDISLADLAAICELHGLEYLPYPFFSRTWLWADAHDKTIPDRLTDGDLHIFHDWIKAYTHADIWVECQVQHSDPDARAVRIAACRRGDRSAFLASQRPDQDVVDVYSVPPFDMGSAVAASVELTAPGAHARIVAPPFFAGLNRDDTNGHASAAPGLLLPVAAPRPAGKVVPRSDVTAMAVVQSRCEPAREWGLGQDRKAVGWVRVRDDGEYVYAPDFSHATPLTEQQLSKRIDRLIAADVAKLRQVRAVIEPPP
ncbi:hypothetical protein ACAG26_20875 [Mycobacterium sp. pUA109]|uniref:hypothetical protein n=1 Tax=Mycobacterium sp. pUA109 TaxID=3238982 RepID=UPI00351BD31D